VSVFRPSARIRSPDGREWEVYVHRFPARERSRGKVAHPDDDVPLRVRLVAGAAARVRALRRDEWTVEAITFMPQRQSYVWRTSKQHRGQVLAQVEGSLARGEVPQRLRHAVYDGWSRSAR
jgi:hypothetical protein